jgi:hypothetical protein
VAAQPPEKRQRGADASAGSPLSFTKRPYFFFAAFFLAVFFFFAAIVKAPVKE